jgi:hypothetical protein
MVKLLSLGKTKISSWLKFHLSTKKNYFLAKLLFIGQTNISFLVKLLLFAKTTFFWVKSLPLDKINIFFWLNHFKFLHVMKTSLLIG